MELTLPLEKFFSIHVMIICFISFVGFFGQLLFNVIPSQDLESSEDNTSAAQIGYNWFGWSKYVSNTHPVNE